MHVYGNARHFRKSPEDFQGVLHQLIGTFEAAYADQWASLSETYRERMLSHIVGFEIAVTKIEAKFKLSQNRTKEEQTSDHVLGKGRGHRNLRRLPPDEGAEAGSEEGERMTPVRMEPPSAGSEQALPLSANHEQESKLVQPTTQRNSSAGWPRPASGGSALR